MNRLLASKAISAIAMSSRIEGAWHGRQPRPARARRRRSPDLLDPRDRVAEGSGNLALEKHTQAQRHDVQHALQIDADHFQRHQGFVQASFLPDEVDKAGDVAGAPRRWSSMPQ